MPVLFILSFIIILIFNKTVHADKGKFIEKHESKNENSRRVFNVGEEVEIEQKTDWGYTVVDGENRYQIPKRMIIRTVKEAVYYEVIEETPLIRMDTGLYKERLSVGERVDVVNDDNDRTIYKTSQGRLGYLEKSHIKPVDEKITNIGVTKKEIEISEDTYLKKGETIGIKDLQGSEFVVLDRDNKEYKIDKNHIAIKEIKGNKKVSRGIPIKRKKDPRVEKVEKIMDITKKQLGKPYIWGATGGSTFDCSGLTTYIYKTLNGINIPRTSLYQSKHGEYVGNSELMPGDLVFFKTTEAPVGHVGIYIGDRKMIHASSGQGKVIESSIDEPYYRTRYVVARRVIK